MNANEDISELFAAGQQQYGTTYADHRLQQYKMYVDSAEKISDRRQKSNEFFLSLNTALVTLLGFISTKFERRELLLLVAIIGVPGITVCYLWFSIIRSYKGLNSGKFAVIHAIEKQLPLSPYYAEWRVLKGGENRSIYWPFTHIEIKVPWVFMTIYAFLILFSLVSWLTTKPVPFLE